MRSNSYLAALVAACIAIVIVNVLGGSSYSFAVVTYYIAFIVVVVFCGYFSLLTAVARVITLACPLVRSFSYLATAIAICIAEVVKLMSIGNSGEGASLCLAIGVAIVCPLVRSNSYLATLITICVAVIIVLVRSNSDSVTVVTVYIAFV